LAWMKRTLDSTVKRSCIHFVTPQQKIIPFDTYNLFYRDELEQTRLAGLRKVPTEMPWPA